MAFKTEPDTYLSRWAPDRRLTSFGAYAAEAPSRGNRADLCRIAGADA